MALSPQKRAAITHDLMMGMSVRKAAAKHKVGQTTVGHISRQLNTDRSHVQPSDPSHARKATAYHEALEEFAVASLKMLKAQAELLGCREYLTARSVDEVIKHSTFVHDRLVKHIEIERSVWALQQPDEAVRALPTPADGAEESEAEIVGEVA